MKIQLTLRIERKQPKQGELVYLDLGEGNISETRLVGFQRNDLDDEEDDQSR